MKIFLSILIAMAPLLSLGQTFYVEPTTYEYEKKVYEQLRFDGYKLTDSLSQADYKVECFASTSKPYKGYVKISDAKSGVEISRTKQITTSGYNPRHAGNKIMGRVTSSQYWKKLMAPIKG